MLWRADRGCTDFISDFLTFFLRFCSEVVKIIKHYPESRMMCLFYGGYSVGSPEQHKFYSCHMVQGSGKPSGRLTLQLGQQKCLPEVCASPEELPNTRSWANLCPAASTTSMGCSSVSISEFNGEFQLLPIPAMDLPLSLLLQLGSF